MRKILFGLLTIFLLSTALEAEQESKVLGEVETNWPGIKYQILFIHRIPPERLLVGICLVATAAAPSGGTMIGVAVPTPANANKTPGLAGGVQPRPLILTTSMMTEELTGQAYPALNSVAPPGKAYPPGAAFGNLLPGHSFLMTLQFAIPPPPPIPPGATAPPKQTLSFTFANAKGPLQHVTLAPANPAATPAPAK